MFTRFESLFKLRFGKQLGDHAAFVFFLSRVPTRCVSPVHVDGLQQAAGHPGPQHADVVAEEHDADEEPGAQDQGLSRVGVLSLHAERSLGDRRHATLLNSSYDHPSLCFTVFVVCLYS